MLGSTDESHIIRTIEYWDLERRRYPQYDHYAVIAAEDVTSRFLNVIGLFNGSIPLIALQMSALKFGDQISLVFTKVFDAVSLGKPDEDEEVQEVTDRNYWETVRGTKETVALADDMLGLIKTFAPDLEPRTEIQQVLHWAREGWTAKQLRYLPGSKEQLHVRHSACHLPRHRPAA